MRLSLVLLASVDACTRILYETGDDNYIVGRSMYWFECLGSDLWSFPREMSRDGGTGPKALAWTSKYGSVVVDAYDIAATDGMNEKGLVGNVLYLAEAEYGDADPDKPQISIATSVFWVDVPKLDLAPGAAPRKLAVSAALAGEVSGAFLPAEPFTYLNHQA